MMYWSLENVPWTNLHDLNLDWIVNTMKQTVEQWIAYRIEMNQNYSVFTENIEQDFSELQQNFSELQQNFSELQQYVHDYFDNLDLNESTRYVINQMIESGEFITVLNPSIVASVADWLDQHVTPTTPIVDDTLTISGAAADAKTTGDVVSDFELSSTEIALGNVYLEQGMLVSHTGVEKDNTARVRTWFIPASDMGTLSIGSDDFKWSVFAFNADRSIIESTSAWQTDKVITLEDVADKIPATLAEIKFVRFLFKRDGETDFAPSDLSPYIRLETAVRDCMMGDTRTMEILEAGTLLPSNGSEMDNANRVRTLVLDGQSFGGLTVETTWLRWSVFAYDDAMHKIANTDNWQTSNSASLADIASLLSITTAEIKYLRFAFNPVLGSISPTLVSRHISLDASVWQSSEITFATRKDAEQICLNKPWVEPGGLKTTNGDIMVYAERFRTDYIPVEWFRSIKPFGVIEVAVYCYRADKTFLENTGWIADTVLSVARIAETLSLNASDIGFVKIVFKSNDINSTIDEDLIRANTDFVGVQASSSVFSGKTVAIFGDSISTYKNWIPTGNATFYTGSNAGVTSVYDTWWMKVISTLGMELLVNNSWSGRAVGNCRDEQTGHTTDAAYKLANVQALGANGTPDIIIIKLGINDFNHAGPSNLLGDYDGSTSLPNDPTLFTNAYAMMLDLVMTTYPLAKIYCCTLMQCERTTTAIGFPELNPNGESLIDWNAAIVRLAHAFGAEVIEHDACGITQYNISTYMGDYSAESQTGLHPNADGHSLIANSTIDKLDPYVRTRF